ncbi:MAG: P-loop NTPase [Gemmatimonadaceae bacterium]|nr:P-loop NTPase [Gemmatimonadaceae bacterium]
MLDSTLHRFGYVRMLRADSMSQAIERHGRVPVDLLVLPLDDVDDAGLAAIDRTVWREHELRVIATGPVADPRLMLRAMRAGIQEFLVRPLVEEECHSAVDRLHKRVDPAESKGQVFAVYSAKGGVGVSTVAVNLASTIATLHPASRVSVADIGVPGGDASILLNLRPTYNLGDLASKIDRLDDELLNSVLTPAGDGLWMLAATERPEDGEGISAKVIATVVAQLRSTFAFTVLDCEHQLNDRTLAALDAADRILLLTELQVPAMRSTQRTLGMFRRLGYPTEKIAVVINRYRSGDVVSSAEAAEVFKEEIFFKVPNDYKIVSEAGTAGVPVEIKDPNSPLTFAYRQLAQKLAGGTIPFAAPHAAQNGSRAGLRGLFARKRTGA